MDKNKNEPKKMSDKERQEKLSEHQRLTDMGAGLDAHEIHAEIKEHDARHGVQSETDKFNQSGVEQQQQKEKENPLDGGRK